MKSMIKMKKMVEELVIILNPKNLNIPNPLNCYTYLSR